MTNIVKVCIDRFEIIILWIKDTIINYCEWCIACICLKFESQYSLLDVVADDVITHLCGDESERDEAELLWRHHQVHERVQAGRLHPEVNLQSKVNGDKAACTYDDMYEDSIYIE